MKVAKEVKKKFEERKGITLIALVITIIVLLILAGVSITMLTGENSILKQATSAKDKTIEGQEEEGIRVAYSGVLSNYIGEEVTATRLEDELKRNGHNVSVEEDVDKLLIMFIDTKHLYSLDKNGNIKVEEDISGMTLVEAFKKGKIQIGDYVDYVPEDTTKTVTVEEKDTGIDANQTFSVDTDAVWKVMGLNEDETELLITTAIPILKDINLDGNDYEKNALLYMKGAEAYCNGPSTLNTICEIYSNSSYSSKKARSMTFKDINNILGIVEEEYGVVYRESDESKTNLNFYGGGLEQYKEGYEYKIGDYAPENYVKEKYDIDIDTKKAGDKIYGNSCSYFAFEGEDGFTANEENKLIFPTYYEDGVLKGVGTYFLATNGAFAFPSRTTFALRKCLGNGRRIYSFKCMPTK